MWSSGVHHVELVVSSVERSLPFYRGLLGPLGWPNVAEVEGDHGEKIWYLWQQASSIELREASRRGGLRGVVEAARRRWQRARPIALQVESREAVDDRFHWLLERGAEVTSEPHAYGTGSPRYGVFFRDPDGFNLELVHVGEERVS